MLDRGVSFSGTGGGGSLGSELTTKPSLFVLKTGAGERLSSLTSAIVEKGPSILEMFKLSYLINWNKILLKLFY